MNESMSAIETAFYTFQSTRTLINILLMILVGVVIFLVSAYVDRKSPHARYRKALFCGLALSFLVEIIQYVSCRGRFEWDDMLHNAIGCMLGALVFQIFYSRLGVSRKGSFNDT